MKIILPVSVILAIIAGAFAAQAEMKLPDLKKQPSAQAVLDEHFAALNKCDWDRLLAQYPEDAQINLPGGKIVKGRAAIGDLFAGFCKDPKDGGLNGIHFAVEHSTTIENTFATQWVATAPFLAEPYRGSDAYITHDGYMQAMVTTFDGSALKMKK
jgi:SnoaL-like domain